MCAEPVKTNTTEDNTSNSLMKKTKVQLVDIILRKDAVERSLRDALKFAENNVSDYSENYNKLKNRYLTLTTDFTEQCDESETVIAELNQKILKYKLAFYMSVVISFVLLFAIIVF